MQLSAFSSVWSYIALKIWLNSIIGNQNLFFERYKMDEKMKKSFSQSAEHLLSAKEKGTEIRDRTRNAIPMECCMDIKER